MFFVQSAPMPAIRCGTLPVELGWFRHVVALLNHDSMHYYINCIEIKVLLRPETMVIEFVPSLELEYSRSFVHVGRSRYDRRRSVESVYSTPAILRR